MIPGLGWMADLLGSDNLSSSINNAVEKASSGNVFGSIAGLFADISQTIKQKFLDNALYMIPDTILGFPVRALIAQKLGLKVPPGTTTKADGWVAEKIASAAGYDQKALEDIKPPETPSTETQTSETLSTPITQAKDIVIDENGGMVVSSPREGGLFQLSKNDGILAAPFSNKDGDKDTSLLELIAKNTEHTNTNFNILSQAINNLAQTLGSKMQNANNTNLFVNGQQAVQGPTASQIAATNFDPIKHVRQQFKPVFVS
jgi:hypothetical protein